LQVVFLENFGPLTFYTKVTSMPVSGNMHVKTAFHFIPYKRKH